MTRPKTPRKRARHLKGEALEALVRRAEARGPHVTLKEFAAEAGVNYTTLQRAVLRQNAIDAKKAAYEKRIASRRATLEARRAATAPASSVETLARAASQTAVSAASGPPSFRDTIRELVREEVSRQLPEAFARFMRGGA